MSRRSMKEDTSDGTSLVGVSKFGLTGIPTKENPGSLRITRSGFLDNVITENVSATSGNVRAIADRFGTLRSGISNSTSTGYLANGGFGHERPWYGTSGTVGFPKGKALQGNSLVDSVASSRSSSIASSYNETLKVSAANGRPVTRNGGKATWPGDLRKRVVSGDRRPRIREELNHPGDLSSSAATRDLEATPRETPRTTENAPRSILKHDTSTRPKPSPVLPYQKLPEDDNRAIFSAVTTKQREWPYLPCRQQSSQTPSPTSLPPPPFRQSRIPRCTFFNVNGDFRQPNTPPARSRSSDGSCYRRQKFSHLESQYPTRREDAVTGKKSDAKLQTEAERSAMRGWECGTTGDEVGETCDWGATAGSRGGIGVATGRRGGTSDLNDHRKVRSARRARSENDMRRNVRKSPQMEEEHYSEFQNFGRHYGWLSPRTHAQQHADYDHDNEVDGDNDDNAFTSDEQSLRCRHPDYNTRCSWSNLIDIITDTPQQQQQPQPQPQASALDMAPPSVSSEAPGSARPYYRRIFGNMFDWLSRLADLQWSNRKTVTQASENHVVPETTVIRNMSDVSLGQVKLNEPNNSIQGMNLSELTLDKDTPGSNLTGQSNTHMCSFMLGKDSPEPDRSCSKPQVCQKELKSCLSTTCSKVQKSPSELKSCLSNNNSRAQINLAELTPRFSTTCSKNHIDSSELEHYDFLHKARSSEQKLTTFKRQKSPGEPKPSNSRPELKSSEGQSSCYSRKPVRPSDLTTSSSAMEISGSRLDRMQAVAADTISQMREPDFGFQKKLLKSETLLTKSLTKEFEEIAEMPASSRRTAQLRKLLSELPVENFYVVEWLVTNNIINESNATKFGHLFHVKPHVLEVMTRLRYHLFPDAL